VALNILDKFWGETLKTAWRKEGGGGAASLHLKGKGGGSTEKQVEARRSVEGKKKKEKLILRTDPERGMKGT